MHLRVEDVETPFTALYEPGGEVIRMPIAHAEGGNYYTDDPSKVRVVFRYSDGGEGNVTDGGANPNGSLMNIAAIANGRGNVLGTMPPPREGER